MSIITNLSIPSGPIGHIGISLILAYVIGLNPFITGFCGILPDLVDKPLAMIGVGGGRYIGHTLLFVLLISVAFFFWKRKYGLAAIVGGTTHMILDIDGFLPWFYPFKEYIFYESEFNLNRFMQEYFTFSEIGIELILIAIAAAVAFFLLWLLRRRKQYAKKDKSI